VAKSWMSGPGLNGKVENTLRGGGPSPTAPLGGGAWTTPQPPVGPIPPPKGCGGPQPPSEVPDRNAWASHTANRSPTVSDAFKHSGNIRSLCFPFVLKHSSPTLAFATPHFCHSEMPAKRFQGNKGTGPRPPFPRTLPLKGRRNKRLHCGFPKVSSPSQSPPPHFVFMMNANEMPAAPKCGRQQHRFPS